MMNERIVVHKPDGSSSNEILAMVSRNSIISEHAGVLIESGDLITRETHNGIVETYHVLDPGFNEAYDDVPANYQMHVKQLSQHEASLALQKILEQDKSPIKVPLAASKPTQFPQAVIEQALVLIRHIEATLHAAHLKTIDLEAADAALYGVKQQLHELYPDKKIIITLLKFLPQVGDVEAIKRMLSDHLELAG